MVYVWTRPLRIPWFCRNYSESTAHGARQIAISRRLLCASRARYRISFQPSRAGTVPSSPGVISNSFLCGWVGGDKKLAVFLACSLLIFRCTVSGCMVGFWRVAFASLTHTDSQPLRGCLIKATLICACSFSIQVLPQESLLVSAARTHLQLSRERRVVESALSFSNAASLKNHRIFPVQSKQTVRARRNSNFRLHSWP